MTRDELPPQAVNVRNAVSRATFTSTTVQALAQLLPKDSCWVPSLAKHPFRAQRPQPKRNVQTPQAAKRRTRKEPSVAILDDHEDVVPSLALRAKHKLATDVVNVSLKALSAAASQQRKISTQVAGRLSKTGADQTVAEDGAPELYKPLRELSINRISSNGDKKCQSPRLTAASQDVVAPDMLATAECTSIAFTILTSIDAQKLSGSTTSPLQLESGMSVFIGKVIVLGFHELAVKEIQKLRQLLDKSDAPMAQENRRVLDANDNRIDISGCVQEPLSELLAFRKTTVRGPLLGLMVTSQLQILKILAAGSDYRAAEAAIEKLKMDNPSSPVTLIEQQIDPSAPETYNKVAQQLAVLSQLLLQISTHCEARKQTRPSTAGKGINPSVVLQYQALAMKTRLRWWKIAGHQGSIADDVLKPFSRYLASFRQRSTIPNIEKFDLCESLTSEILTQVVALQRESSTSTGENEWAISALQLTVAELAHDFSRVEQARRWLEKAEHSLSLSNSSQRQRRAFHCRQTTLRVRGYPELGSEQHVINDLVNLSSIIGQEMGNGDEHSSDVLRLLGDLRRQILAFIRVHYKKSTTADVRNLSFIVESTKCLCSGMNFISRFTETSMIRLSDKATGGRTLSEKKLVCDTALALIESIALLARSSITCAVEDWRSIQIGLQRCATVAQQLARADWKAIYKTQDSDTIFT